MKIKSHFPILIPTTFCFLYILYLIYLLSNAGPDPKHWLVASFVSHNPFLISGIRPDIVFDLPDIRPDTENSLKFVQIKVIAINHSVRIHEISKNVFLKSLPTAFIQKKVPYFLQF
jgi:hypothetical protein